MNMLLKYAHRTYAQAVPEYLSNYLIPILNNNFNEALLNVVLDGINECISIHVQAVLGSPEALSSIVQMNI